MALYLVSKHVPFDIAMSLDKVEMMAFFIILGEQSGGHWEWDNWRWRT
jgi:hypothetical protein